ncbi:CoA-binding protein [Deinococcus maricopensis]|uniref:CoA-binding domain protein n=1 Tax=Deinococcus maricopensis (strain DSM 21211 / LMG 22137 / NRRL B-23946 / LB-34) TaxID=709986 RepID=E8U5W1_DEIML|nr:CoA-binding protein [Deinococcus maricopensis]ADV66450.1 CoA-binding domain protein [Deinococcus maricopensis DSM 21211]
MILTDIKDVTHVLQEQKVVAVVGFHRDPTKPAHYVPEYLHRQGYTVIPVNPALAGETYFGHKVVARLADIEVPVDIVDVFRRSEAVLEHEADILSMVHAPKTVWLQLGIRNDAFAERLSARGMDVIQDRCMLADHRQYL